MSVKIEYSARSEVGRVRSNNEDNLNCNGRTISAFERERPFFFAGITEPPAIFGVFDGMGGEECGEVASLMAAETLNSHILSDVRDYVVSANSALVDLGIRTGTTMVLAVMGCASFRVYNVGDSRGFVFADGRVIRVTEDHTLAEDKMRMGLLTPEQAELSHERHILTRYLGDEEGVYPDASEEYSFTRYSGGMLCSDGLTDMLTFDEITRIIASSTSPTETVNNLVDAALSNGGRDNVTCIVFKITGE